ncbi:hypothetical protein SAMN05421863_10466 [Nitrosomonas communis]|uniref:Uncharacterized protein n=1 Tax=Nitrosomonas communis TaxID=44574 RepID=A0A1I4T1T7_9PROT|nr:hypothetical protein SAMN05421863_10466 [Nitrosomonas communis]
MNIDNKALIIIKIKADARKLTNEHTFFRRLLNKVTQLNLFSYL